MPFNALSETLSFHKSPESFISSRIANIASADPSQLPSLSSSSSVIRASILNRNVHVISDYHLCHQILSPQYDKGDASRSDAFQALPAYNDLMGPFFPPPNLLLSDGSTHSAWKDRWQQQLSDLPESIEPLLVPLIRGFVRSTFQVETTLDIYGAMKDLAWELLFATFLSNLSNESNLSNKALQEIEALQESLLRGQFSTFPLSIRTPFWSSARSHGVNARVKLQKILKDHFHNQQRERGEYVDARSRCPLLARDEITDVDDIANHVLLFTSGLANKALASLLTSSIINVFLYRPHNPPSSNPSAPSTKLSSLLRSLPRASPERSNILHSILLETERLSPPVIGILRRATTNSTLHPPSTPSSPHTIPSGHEAWLYFPSASRSPTIFGSDAELFRWDRFMHTSTSTSTAPEDLPAPQESLAFGAGPKTCLGRDISRKMVELVINTLLDADLEMEAIPGNGLEPGVQAMLGWCTIEEAGGVQAIARDLKQLPTQRPRRPVLVTVKRPNGG